MSLWIGYMSFLSDAPVCGLRHTPAGGPDEELAAKAKTGAEWADAYGCAHAQYNALLQIASDDAEAAQREPEDDEDEPFFEMDDIYPVHIDDEGTVFIFLSGTHGPEHDLRYTAKDIFDTFGMTFPEKTT